MTGILDHFARTSFPVLPSQFRPASTRHFFALRLAQRLNDEAAVYHYVELCDRYSEGQLLLAYRKAVARSGRDVARSFHSELERIGNRNGNGFSKRHLAAIRIERRAVAVAIFSGDDLEYPPMARQLSSDPDKALGSAAMFINRIRDKCSFNNAAIEALPEGCQAQRSRLAKVVGEVLIEQQVSICKTRKADVLAAFGRPPLRFRNQVREVVSAIWPAVDDGGFGTPLIKDALALGLYCQVESLLSLEN